MIKPLKVILMPKAEEYLSKVEQKIQFKILNSIQKTETGLKGEWFTKLKETMITIQEFKDKYLGEIGTEVRDRYEQELKVELLAEQIKQLRKERNLTQEQLGELVGVQRAQISKMENNTGNVTVATLIKIFGALKAKVTFEIEKEKFDIT
ncbi:MAG: helix-turn-helix domain-containing protein [Bacteroidota bacterium]